ncbi:MAG: endonuclease MutS2 [Planctomycetota bacterium]|jgi:DNA mismatch repair protein MutS2
MDDHTIRVLEFDKILERVAKQTHFALGRERVLAVRPWRDADRIRRETGLATEVKEILVSTGGFPLDGVRDVRPTLRRTRPEGALLDGEALNEVASLLAAGRVLRNTVTSLNRDFPLVTELVSEIRVFPGLERDIRKALDEDGRVLDSATPALQEIRAEIRTLDERIRALLDDYLFTAEWEDTLQEQFVTLRDERHVLPVKAERKTDVPGIIHGRSDTGNTVFIEPMAAVEMGNERKDLAGREAAEVRRILKSLTEGIRSNLDDIEHNLGLLAKADAAQAVARFSIEFNMVPPDVRPGSSLELREARHPLLLFQGTTVVPLDLSLTPEGRTLVISGPNTGGKTVALKTVGLLCLMAQSGLHVPARERSVFPVFRRILADIGDEQSIEASLSTFSSHISRVVEILKTVEPTSLVLLDEMGAATDPQEGGALACAILKRIHDGGTPCIATTHLSLLKAYAHGQEGMENANMEFDEATGRPTYRLRRGTPGSSRALATARTLGVPEDVLHDAEGQLGVDRAAMENLLESLQREQREVAVERAKAEEERSAAATAREEVEKHLAGVDRERKRILREAHLEAEEVLRDFRKEGERVLGQIREIRQAPPKPGAKDRARVEQRRLTELGRRARSEIHRLGPPPKEATGEPPREGQKVAMRTMKGFGTVLRLDEKRGRAEVELDGLRFDVGIDDLIPVKVEDAPRKRRRTEEPMDLRPSAEKEINLLGSRVEPALVAVDRFLDDAVLADREEVRIIHGYGTGALQKAITEFLRGHPSVASFRPGGKGEGGAGATVVKLK